MLGRGGAAVLLLLGLVEPGKGDLPGDWTDGYVSYYGGVAGGGGACGFAGEVTTSFPEGMYAAVDFTLFDDYKGCGACYEIKCTGPFTAGGANNCDCNSNSITIQVDNSCCNREYNTPHFDLNTAAMDAIIDNDIGTCGLAAISYRQVDCDYNSENKNVQIVSKPGTSPYWYAFFVQDVAVYGQIEKAEVRSSGSSTWYDCPYDAAFHKCDSAGVPYAGPLSVRLTDVSGEVLVGTDIITNLYAGNTAFDFGTNFGKSGTPSTPSTPTPGSGSTPSTPTPTPTPTTASTPTPTVATGCPSNDIGCGCSWTNGGTTCGVDDGSECWCKCCCQYTNLCSWSS